MNTFVYKWIVRCVFLSVVLGTSQLASAIVFTFDSNDFFKSPTRSDVTTFQFLINVDAEIVPGGVYDNPSLSIVDYSVSGFLDPLTPSGFSAFALERTLTGEDFYNQGSSLHFEVSPTANLSDGLQMSELVGIDPVFVFNGQELGQTPGRYHPALLELNSDGSGLIRNGNNVGGINPSSGEIVDVEIGEEYITSLTFSPSLTIAATSVPEPTASVILMVALIGCACRQRRR